MTLRDFISRVVPWPGENSPGFVNLHWTSPRGPGLRGKPFTDVEDFLSSVAWSVKHPQYVSDIYYCLSLQAQTGKVIRDKPVALRLQQNALAVKAVWLDIDIKEKAYGTLPEALDGLKQFLKDASLPAPTAMVVSGGGLHVYWISDKPLSRDDWRSYAEGLKTLVMKHGLKVPDLGLTTDCARVLRVPDTFNCKTTPPRPVKLLALQATDYNFETALAELPKLAPVTATVNSVSLVCDEDKFPIKQPHNQDKLSDGVEKRTTELDWGPMAKECPFFLDALENGGKDHGQGLWNLTVLMSTFLQSGRKLAHKLGGQHKDYTPESTDAMFDRKEREKNERALGWPSCGKIQTEGSPFCATCKHNGRIKSPLNLAVPQTPKVTPPVPGSGPKASWLPDGYTEHPDTGFIGQIVERHAGGGVMVPEFAQLFSCKLTHPWVQKDPDALNFTCTTDLGNTRRVSIPMVALSNTHELLKQLLAQSVKFYVPNEQKLRAFFMAFLTKLHEAQQAVASVPFGWLLDGSKRIGFVYGGQIMHRDGTDSPAGFADGKLREIYNPTGEIGPWFDALRLITAQKRPELEVIAASSFAAPLMFVTGENSGSFHAWGITGGGKSTAMKVGLSVWGHPKQTKDVMDSTSKSFVNKMGMLRHIPLFWDEIRDEQTLGKLFSAVFSAAEGVEQGRLNKDITQRDRGEWQTAVISCSNLSLIDYISKKQRTTNAGCYRVFEYKVPDMDPNGPGNVAFYDASRITQELEYNYGIMGMKYAKLLASDPEAIDKFAYDILEKFSKEVDAQRPERFWAAACASVIAGASLANLLGCDFHIPEIKAFLVSAFAKLRSRVKAEALEGGTLQNTEEVLTIFLKERVPNTIYTDVLPLNRGRPKKVDLIWGPSQMNPRAIHVHWVVRTRELRFSRNEFKKFLDESKTAFTSVMEGLTEHFKAKVQYSCLGAGTTYRTGQESLIIIPVPHGSPWEDLMYAHTSMDEREKFTGAVIGIGSSVTQHEPPAARAVSSAMQQAAKDLETVREQTT